MSTTLETPRQAPDQQLTGENAIRIVSHSHLFYWWPVWAIGFVMAAITWFDNHLMAIVPNGTTYTQQANREVLVAPRDVNPKNPSMAPPRLLMAESKNLGVIFCIILLLVIATTNIPLRGLWSVLIIMAIIFATALVTVLGWWEGIVETLDLLDIRINLGGYLFLSILLFAVWLMTLLLFDRQIYMVFTPGQLRVRLEIGAGETAYDTRGMTIQKRRSDLFRHCILGLGSGDLLVNTSGAQAHHFDLPNVLFVGRKVKEIEYMLRTMPIVGTQS
jgi:uncharacterized membrane protein YkgB